MRPWHQDDDAGTWLIIGLRHQGTCTVQAVTEMAWGRHPSPPGRAWRSRTAWSARLNW